VEGREGVREGEYDYRLILDNIVYCIPPSSPQKKRKRRKEKKQKSYILQPIIVSITIDIK
jgi:hypothetical protein